MAWLRDSASTEFHPSSSCAMLPREQGGVVDANLRVYGLANVRVADASVPPIALSTHLMASTYGVAEQASHIIRSLYDRTSRSTPITKSNNDTKGSGILARIKSHSNNSHNGNGSAPLHIWISLIIVAAHVVVTFN